MTKKIIIFITLFALTILPVQIAFAVAAGDITSGTKDWQEKYQTATSANAEGKVAALKELGKILIENRIQLLTNLQNSVNNMSVAKDQDKTDLIADISQNMVDLSTLRARMEAETTAESLKSDIREITETYKIYSVVAPRDLGESLVYRGRFILGKLKAIQEKIQTFIDDKKAEGVDTATLEVSMKEVTNKLIDAESQMNIALEKFKAMTPANSATAKTSRAEGKVAMKKAKDDLNAAHILLKEIVESLKTLPSASPLIAPTPSISPSITPAK